MNDPILVSMMNGAGKGFYECRRRSLRHGLAALIFVEAPARNIFERQEGAAFVVADFEDLHDVRVMQAGHGPRFRQEAIVMRRIGMRAGQNHFDGDKPIELRLAGPVDHAHAATAELFEDFVARDALYRSRRRRHRLYFWRRNGSELGMHLKEPLEPLAMLREATVPFFQRDWAAGLFERYKLGVDDFDGEIGFDGQARAFGKDAFAATSFAGPQTTAKLGAGAPADLLVDETFEVKA